MCRRGAIGRLKGGQSVKVTLFAVKSWMPAFVGMTGGGTSDTQATHVVVATTCVGLTGLGGAVVY
jgi:hypothetical protein